MYLCELPNRNRHVLSLPVLIMGGMGLEPIIFSSIMLEEQFLSEMVISCAICGYYTSMKSPYLAQDTNISDWVES